MQNRVCEILKLRVRSLELATFYQNVIFSRIQLAGAQLYYQALVCVYMCVYMCVCMCVCLFIFF